MVMFCWFCKAFFFIEMSADEKPTLLFSDPIGGKSGNRSLYTGPVASSPSPQIPIIWYARKNCDWESHRSGSDQSPDFPILQNRAKFLWVGLTESFQVVHRIVLSLNVWDSSVSDGRKSVLVYWQICQRCKHSYHELSTLWFAWDSGPHH